MALNIFTGRMANSNQEKYVPVEYPKRKRPGALKHLMKQHADTRGEAIAEGKMHDH